MYIPVYYYDKICVYKTVFQGFGRQSGFKHYLGY